MFESHSCTPKSKYFVPHPKANPKKTVCFERLCNLYFKMLVLSPYQRHYKEKETRDDNQAHQTRNVSCSYMYIDKDNKLNSHSLTQMQKQSKIRLKSQQLHHLLLPNVVLIYKQKHQPCSNICFIAVCSLLRKIYAHSTKFNT